MGRSGPPVDPRLLRYSRATRRYVVVTAVATTIGVVATIVTAAMTASILSELITDPTRRSLGAQSVHLWVLAAAVVVNVLTHHTQERYAFRASATAIAELRRRAVCAMTDPRRTSPRTLLHVRDRATTILLRGLDGLEPYLSGYVPALVVTVLVTPTVVAVIAVTDWPSAVIILATLPLIPLFMVLIGLMTRERTRRKLDTMSSLGSQLLDLIEGLPTLRALHRATRPGRRVAELGVAHRRNTISALRVAFISGGVLELLATLCVALVAVGIGVRLVYGEMSLYAGVLALVLAPEAYLPLRTVGAQFHNSADGVAAARDVLDLVDGAEGDGDGNNGADSAAADREPAGQPTAGAVCAIAGQPVRIDDVSVAGRDGWAPHGLTAVAAPGEITMLTGPNGSGKSTVLALILGLITPDRGAVRVGEVPVGLLEADDLYRQVAWLPQRPVLLPGTVEDNLRLFGAEPSALSEAASVTGFGDVLAGLPDGVHTVLGAGGLGLSAGQRQRLALARTLACSAPLLLLDEPTAHLDDAAEAGVFAALRRRADAGATVVVVAHRHTARGIADHVVDLGSGAHVR